MRVVQTINIAQIDHGKRLPINTKVLLFAIEMAFRRAIFPPVNVERVSGGRYKLRGGRHRLAAHKLIGKRSIRASVAITEEPYPYKPLVAAVDKQVLHPSNGSLANNIDGHLNKE